MSEKIYIKLGNRKWRVPAWVTAHLVGCDEDTVRKIRQGTRSGETDTGQMVELADTLLTDKINPIIQQVSDLVKIDTKPQQ